MGKHKHDNEGTGFENVTQAQVNEALQPHEDLPPQSDDLKAKQALLGKRVRVFDRAHMVTVEITDYEDGAYHGIAKRAFSMDSSEQVPVQYAIHGLSPYPNAERPDVLGQWVEPGQDESVLINIANVEARQHAGAPVVEEPTGEQSGGN